MQVPLSYPKILKGTILFYLNDRKQFTNHEHYLQKGDMLYLFSDGFADQLGGNGTQKFMHQRFIKLLTDVTIEQTQDQETLLNKALEN